MCVHACVCVSLHVSACFVWLSPPFSILSEGITLNIRGGVRLQSLKRELFKHFAQIRFISELIAQHSTNISRYLISKYIPRLGYRLNHDMRILIAQICSVWPSLQKLISKSFDRGLWNIMSAFLMGIKSSFFFKYLNQTSLSNYGFYLCLYKGTKNC